jgi:hypothetical protein
MTTNEFVSIAISLAWSFICVYMAARGKYIFHIIKYWAEIIIRYNTKLKSLQLIGPEYKKYQTISSRVIMKYFDALLQVFTFRKEKFIIDEEALEVLKCFRDTGRILVKEDNNNA